MGMPAASDCLVPLGILGSVPVQGLTNSEHKGKERALLYRLVLIAASVSLERRCSSRTFRYGYLVTT